MKYSQVVYNFHKTYGIRSSITSDDTESDIEVTNDQQRNSGSLMKYYQIICKFYKICNSNFKNISDDNENILNNEPTNDADQNKGEQDTLSFVNVAIVFLIFSILAVSSQIYFGDLEETRAFLMSLSEPQIRHFNMFRFHKVLKLGCAKILKENIPMPVIKEDVVGEIVEEFFESSY